jgi:superfamily I DNA/RNA helicase
MASLNPDQAKAVDANGHLVLGACPGSGKTTVLVARSERLLNSDPSCYVALVTFTKDAANEMKERLVKKLGQSASKRVITGTFHGLSLALLRKKNPKIRPIAESDQMALITQARRVAECSIGVEDVLLHIAEAKSHYPPRPPMGRDEANLVYKEYQKLCSRNGVLDFADLINHSAEGIENGDIDPLPVKYMLVDEFQDTDECQLAWVNAHIKRGVQVTVVGDDDQSIYGWRAAMGYRGMKSFADTHKAQVLTLPLNYRCSPDILMPARKLIEVNKDRLQKAIQAFQTEPGDISALRFPTKSHEAKHCAEYIAASTGSWAVLARTKASLSALERHLNVNQVPFQRIGGSGFWDGAIPSALLNILQALVYRNAVGVLGALQWANLLASSQAEHPDKNISADDYVERLFETHQGDSATDKDVRAFVEAWRGWRETLNMPNLESPTIGAVGTWMKSRVGDTKTDKSAKKREKIISDAVYVLKKLKGPIYKRVNAVQMSGNADDSVASLKLMTLHASKGLEFDRVWMIGCNDGIIPHSKSVLESASSPEEGIAEERRLFFVGMTRARKELICSFADFDKVDADEPVPLQPSPFIAESGMPIEDDGVSFVQAFTSEATDAA